MRTGCKTSTQTEALQAVNMCKYCLTCPIVMERVVWLHHVPGGVPTRRTDRHSHHDQHHQENHELLSDEHLGAWMISDWQTLSVLIFIYRFLACRQSHCIKVIRLFACLGNATGQSCGEQV